MLKTIGFASIEDLLRSTSKSPQSTTPLHLPQGISEQRLLNELKGISKKNATVDNYISFLGAGAYNHYIPSAVKHITSRSEFYTAYTPYQPEVSQGTLQAIFEYQTLICQLTGMEVSNASMYDGASATAEAALMASRITRRQNVVLSSTLHPEYRETIRTYLREQPISIDEISYCTETGSTLATEVEAKIGKEPACLIVQHPNFFGSLEELGALVDVIHKGGGLLIVVVTEPVSLCILKPPGDYGADIVVGEGQSFGNNLSFGGPYLGFFATLERYARQMPGRLIGETVDSSGNRSFCLTLATREQHIRRERATSNICTNEGLCALASAVYLALYGKEGLKELARLNLSKAAYLKNLLLKIPGIEIAFTSPTFNEFVIELETESDSALKVLLQKGILGGLALNRFYPELSRHVLLCATEMNSKKDMDTLAKEISAL